MTNIPVSAIGSAALASMVEVAAMLNAWRLRSRFSGDDDLIFPNRRGGYMCHADMVKRRFKPLFAKTGVAPFNWHALCHFAVSR